MAEVKLILGDCIEIIKTLKGNSIDSIVTDPPAGISFMGKEWDKDKGGRDKWIEWMTQVALECLRVLKPGGHAVVWALPRTSHWTATAWENAGFEVRDRIEHVFGSGFPKSYNIAKGIEGVLVNGSASWNDFHKLNGTKGDENVRGANGLVKLNAENGNRPNAYESHGTLDLEPTTEEAKQWEGWGTALKPACEDWWLFRKPISEKTVVENVLKWGTGGLNIDACRVEYPAGDDTLIKGLKRAESPRADIRGGNFHVGDWSDKKHIVESGMTPKGRWPANLIHDGSDDVVNLFPVTTSGTGAVKKKSGKGYSPNSLGKESRPEGTPNIEYGGTGSAARFFYCAKPDKSERDAGLQKLPDKIVLIGAEGHKINPITGKEVVDLPRKNNHPTVKPLALMQYLITLVTPPFGTVLDCFMGSGTTGAAAIKMGFNFIGCDNDEDYFIIAKTKIDNTQHGLF